MYRIKTLNKISSAGLDQLDKSRFQIGTEVENEDGILVRSAPMHDYVFPEELRSAGRARYVERNRIMIDWADSCVFYYRGESTVADRAGRKRKSGTALAWDYAVKRKKDIYNVSEIMCPENFLK